MRNHSSLFIMATYNSILSEYRERYDLESLSNPNDKSNLDMLINNQLIISKMQEEMQMLVDTGDIITAAPSLAKIQGTIQSLIDLSLQIERTLGIDRKSRKRDNQEDIGQYIASITSAAEEWLERNLIYVYCPDCKVMVSRIMPVHEHTDFESKWRCSQCEKMVEVKRKGKDIFFNVKGDKTWRKKYPIEIKQPTSTNQEFGDEIVIGDMDGN